MNRLRHMSIFAHIVEEGSISAAAAKLSLSKSVISQHLKVLESELGVTLIKRTTRKQWLTKTGALFYQNCTELNAIAESAWYLAQEDQSEPQGRICITAPNALMDLLVCPVIAELMTKYPKIKPELISDDQHVNLMQHDIDLAIRVGSSHDSNLKQQRLGEFRDILCCSANVKVRDLNQLPYIANHWQGSNIKHQFKTAKGGDIVYEKEASCIANSFHSCLALIKAGAGVGVIPDFYFSQFESELTRLMPNSSLSENTVYAISPYNRNVPIAVKVCTEKIKERLIAKE